MVARVFAFLMVIAIAACAGFEFPDPTPDDFPIHGIDVSRYQGEIDWQEVRRSGVEFVWIKATEGGDYLDPKFHSYWEGARAAGIPAGPIISGISADPSRSRSRGSFRTCP